MDCSKRETGLTLVELMIAMVIGLILLAGIGQIFLANKNTYRTLEALSHIQESGRFAMGFLAEDIRMADFWGCQVNSSNITDHVDHSTVPSGASFANSWNTNGLEGTEGTGLNGSDTITLRGALNPGIFVEQHPATPSAALKVTMNSGIVEGDFLFITDCEMGEFFVVTDNTGSAGFDNIGHNTGNNGAHAQNDTQVFGKKYGRDAAVYKFGEVTYDLKTGTGGEPSLFVTYNLVASELVSGIENMQVLYGVDIGANGNIDYYANATTVTAASVWQNVVTVRVTITARSPEQNVIIDAAGSSADNRMRHDFVSTMAVRNRLN